MPRISARVVCTLCEMMLTLEPTNALRSVDLPVLGAPIRAMKPQLVSLLCVWASVIKLVRRHADACEHGGSGRLFGSAFGVSEPFRRRPIG